MNAMLILAAEEGGQAGLSVILPAAAELVYGAIAFAIVYFVLAKYAFPRINEMLDERRDAIQGRMEEAEEAKREAERAREQYQSQLEDAKGEANRIIEEAKQTAESLRRDIVAKAEAEAQAIVSRAQSEIQAERERTLQELRQEVGNLSVQLASKIVEKELDRDRHEALVNEYINRLSSTS
ncbi:MAG: F0F1 ATP synthase subunit B [Nitriliruptorales bacterium]|nr:F0F1 ATP synthase subunit B [Nitriliruptorales bacterium]